MVKYSLYDAFERKKTAQSAASDLRAAGDRVTVRKLSSPQAGGRLKWGVYQGGSRKKKRRN